MTLIMSTQGKDTDQLLTFSKQDQQLLCEYEIDEIEANIKLTFSAPQYTINNNRYSILNQNPMIIIFVKLLVQQKELLMNVMLKDLQLQQIFCIRIFISIFASTVMIYKIIHQLIKVRNAIYF
ncbi:Hypothetical_protein [Hexamita inflata]|uniref:Hypothetical_protein n=1 Tax=Hexamita inflata TaxID=28002 RepID=A0ABP1LTH4_9EUKA